MSAKHAANGRIRSMTGYALVRRETTAGELTVSLRAVNHRGLDLHFHCGAELARFENNVRAVVKEAIGRGHVEVRLFLARADGGASSKYNRELVASYLGLFQEVADEFGLAGEPDLNVIFTLPGVFDGGRDSAALDDSFEAELLGAVTQCAQELNAFREREGEQTARALASEVEGIEQAAARIAAIRGQATVLLYTKLRDRLAELLSEGGVSESRLCEEAAVLADRSDVQEELTRLGAHTQELRRTLETGGAVGKKMDFLLQEMNRETSTLLAKTSGAGEIGLTVTNRALGIKANIERIREQALNLE